MARSTSRTPTSARPSIRARCSGRPAMRPRTSRGPARSKRRRRTFRSLRASSASDLTPASQERRDAQPPSEAAARRAFRTLPASLRFSQVFGRCARLGAPWPLSARPGRESSPMHHIACGSLRGLRGPATTLRLRARRPNPTELRSQRPRATRSVGGSMVSLRLIRMMSVRSRNIT